VTPLQGQRVVAVGGTSGMGLEHVVVSARHPSGRPAWARVAQTMPVRGMGTSNDIAHAAVFLMTNPQVTGAVLEVTGGESLVDTLDARS
jgi:hypothetical protein